MSLVITDPKAEQLAQELARKIGGTVPDAVVRALEAQLVSLKAPSTTAITRDSILNIAARCKALPDLDPRSADEYSVTARLGCHQKDDCDTSALVKIDTTRFTLYTQTKTGSMRCVAPSHI